MAAIVKTIITSTSTIVDADGALGYGTVRVRPAQEFEYTGTASDLFTVSTAAQEVVIAAGIISSGTLALAPNVGASNSPVTSHYIVDLDINGVQSTQYWQIDTADGGSGSVDIEFANVTRLPNEAGAGTSTDDLLALNDPFPQYAKRSDTVQSDTTYPHLTADSLDPALGRIMRLDVNTGHAPTDVVNTASVKALAITGAKIAAATITEDKLAVGSTITTWFAGVTIEFNSAAGGSITISDGTAGKSGNYNAGVATNSADATTGKITIYNDTTGTKNIAKIYLPITVGAVLTTECTLVLTLVSCDVTKHAPIIFATPDASSLFWTIDAASVQTSAPGTTDVYDAGANLTDFTVHITILQHK